MENYLGPRFTQLTDENRSEALKFKARQSQIARSQNVARLRQAEAGKPDTAAPLTTTAEVYLGKTGGLSEYERQQQFLAGARSYNRNLPQTAGTQSP